MNAIIPSRPMSVPRMLTFIGKASAGVLFGVWAALASAEFIANHFQLPALNTVYQAIALAIVFYGFYFSLKHPVRGSYVSVVGVILFFVVARITTGLWPPAAAAWLVFPAVLILAAVGYRQNFRHRGQS
jgi:hypothetical protein